MGNCDFCKTVGQKTGMCVNCGTDYYIAGLTFIYGPTVNHGYSSEVRLTDKYLIVRKVSKGEMAGNLGAGAGFGVLGIMVNEALKSAKKKTYAFYDLKELDRVIYPYYTNTLKKDTAFKFVNKDGSDFVLNFNLNGMFCSKVAREFAAMLPKVGICVENGTGTIHPVCCEKPFVTIDTFATRVCPSAAAFVQMEEPQFAAPAISEGEQPVQPLAAEEQPAEEAPAEAVPVETPGEETPEEVRTEAPVQIPQKKTYSVEEWISKW